MVTDLDAELEAIAAGDAEAFARWLSSAERPVRESLRAFAAQVDTEAVLQEALLRVWQVAPRIVRDGRPNALLRLTVRVARNLALDEARRMRCEPVELDRLARLADADADPDPAPPDPLLRARIAECREKLPRKPAAALAARLDSGGAAPDAALAARLGMQLNTFLQNITRAKKLLADCLRRAGIEVPA